MGYCVVVVGVVGRRRRLRRSSTRKASLINRFELEKTRFYSRSFKRSRDRRSTLEEEKNE